MPAEYQVSSMVHSHMGIIATTWSMTLPASLTAGQPIMAQSECRQPLDQGHLPVTTRPPSTRRVVAVGERTPAIRASGFAPQMSSWHSADVMPTINELTFMRVVAQAVDPHPRASAAETSILVRRSA